MSTHSVREQLLEKFKDKEYRDLFVAEHLYAGLALKNRLLREQRKWTQKQLGEKAGMAQAWISRLEDPNYGKLTISTLLKLASVYDVGLEINFVSFSKILHDALSFDSKSFVVRGFDNDLAGLTATQATGLASSSIEGEQWRQIQEQLLKPQLGATINAVTTTNAVITIPSVHLAFSNALHVSSGMATLAISGPSDWASIGHGIPSPMSNYTRGLAIRNNDMPPSGVLQFLYSNKEGQRYGRTAA